MTELTEREKKMLDEIKRTAAELVERDIAPEIADRLYKLIQAVEPLTAADLEPDPPGTWDSGLIGRIETDEDD